MKNSIIILFILIGSTTQSVACDACNMYEYVSTGNKSYIGLFYRYRFFQGIDKDYVSNNKTYYSPLHTSNNGGILDPSSNDYELYQTYELRFNYTIKNKFNLMINLPIQKTNVYYESIYMENQPVTDSSFSFVGLGDIFLSFDKFDAKEIDEWKYITKFGAGIKIPTGKNDIGDHDETMQPGTGSIDILFRGSVTGLFKQKYGLSLNGSYKLNSYNANQYKFGNATNIRFDLFYIGGLTSNWIPRLGLYYEYSAKDTDDDHIRENTGGHTTMLHGGVDFKIRNFTFQSLYQLPIIDKLNDDILENKSRFTVGVIYNF